MLTERKFDGPDDVFFGSPQIASAQHAILNAIIQSEPHKAAQWEAWRDARGHTHILERIRSHLHDHHELVVGWDHDTRRSYVEALLAPLIPDTDLLAELTSE